MFAFIPQPTIYPLSSSLFSLPSSTLLSLELREQTKQIHQHTTANSRTVDTFTLTLFTTAASPCFNSLQKMDKQPREKCQLFTFNGSLTICCCSSVSVCFEKVKTFLFFFIKYFFRLNICLLQVKDNFQVYFLPSLSPAQIFFSVFNKSVSQKTDHDKR